MRIPVSAKTGIPTPHERVFISHWFTSGVHFLSVRVQNCWNLCRTVQSICVGFGSAMHHESDRNTRQRESKGPFITAEGCTYAVAAAVEWNCPHGEGQFRVQVLLRRANAVGELSTSHKALQDQSCTLNPLSNHNISLVQSLGVRGISECNDVDEMWLP